MLGGSWGGGGESGGFQGSLLPLLVLTPVPELHPSPHHSIPPSNLPAPGVTLALSLTQDIILDPGQRGTQPSLSWSPSHPGAGDSAEPAQVSQVNKVSEVGPGDPLETVLL